MTLPTQPGAGKKILRTISGRVAAITHTFTHRFRRKPRSETAGGFDADYLTYAAEQGTWRKLQVDDLVAVGRELMAMGVVVGFDEDDGRPHIRLMHYFATGADWLNTPICVAEHDEVRIIPRPREPASNAQAVTTPHSSRDHEVAEVVQRLKAFIDRIAAGPQKWSVLRIDEVVTSLFPDDRREFEGEEPSLETKLGQLAIFNTAAMLFARAHVMIEGIIDRTDGIGWSDSVTVTSLYYTLQMAARDMKEARATAETSAAVDWALAEEREIIGDAEVPAEQETSAETDQQFLSRVRKSLDAKKTVG